MAQLILPRRNNTIVFAFSAYLEFQYMSYSKLPTFFDPFEMRDARTGIFLVYVVVSKHFMYMYVSLNKNVKCVF